VKTQEEIITIIDRRIAESQSAQQCVPNKSECRKIHILDISQENILKELKKEIQND
jgi:hypothetical protein